MTKKQTANDNTPRKPRVLWLYLANLAALCAFAVYFFVINPAPTKATLALRQALQGVTEVRVRVGCLSRDSGSSKRVVLTLKGEAADEFVQALQVKYNPAVGATMTCSHYTFEFYRQKQLMAEMGYSPNLLIWHPHAAQWKGWRDGAPEESDRALTWQAKRHLRQLLAPYAEIRKAEIYR